MPNEKHPIEQTFLALSDPTRRAVVQTLCGGSATVSQLASPFDMALPSFTQHLGVLEDAGLIVSRREGRSRVCSLNPSALKEAEDWMASYRKRWESRLDRFQAHLHNVKKENLND
ncbi:metalloregulator ArsR/SmtB family transcription factor [Pseudosulfitobacter sp. DSM 107133]|uniref:ArsR/SmtB family transcription factor n=1 Tax=Pseudosulfitobacter sp. DSM 107133 TaxID=2883100 RepID=UPI000DF17C5B|nr:metalloregulator ArsR/SmtB family transcription factor [Pseudosulfitobacter sp. DSM 107133]